MRNVSEKCCRENKKIMFSNIFKKSHAIYEIMWKNIVEPDRPQ
jgi:hypothetical protein